MTKATSGADRKAQELNIFHDVAKALTSSLDLDSILQTIMEKMAEYFRPDNWSLLMVDEERDELYFAIAVGKGDGLLERGKRFGDAAEVATHKPEEKQAVEKQEAIAQLRGKSLGAEFTPKVKEAWATVYAVLATTMREAAVTSRVTSPSTARQLNRRDAA